MLDIVRRVILSFTRRPTKVMARRSPAQRLKARLYYRAHKNKIRLARRRYNMRTRIFSKSRKMFKRARPSWLHKAMKGVSRAKPVRPKHPHPIKKYIHKLIGSPKVKKHKTPGIYKPKKFKLHVPR